MSDYDAIGKEVGLQEVDLSVALEATHEIKVVVSSDYNHAFLTVDVKSGSPVLNKEDIMGLLANKSITYGINYDAIESVIIDAKYEGYLEKQNKLVRSFRNLENQKVPEDIDYSQVPHLRAEAKERLSTVRPYTLGQAGRLGGITPSDITIIQLYLKRIKGWD